MANMQKSIREFETNERILRDVATLSGDALDRIRRSEERAGTRQDGLEAEVEELKARLVRAERLSSLGGLLAGIVHELNNPLTAILGFAELLARSDGRSNELDKIVAESERCARIVQNVLSVAGSGSRGEAENIGVNSGIRQAVELVSFQLRLKRVRLNVELARSEPHITANSCQFVQIMLNLLTNAVQAIAGENLSSAANRAARGSIDVCSRIEGGNVLITVRDDGPGIDGPGIKRIFEPFFTTKQAGTGLGLSLSKQLVEENGGTLRVESRVGEGTAFSLSFPLTVGVVEDSTRKRILVVDDESRILELMEAVLSRPGFDVRCAESGEGAMEQLAEGHCDLLISDMRMPGMDGAELVAWARTHAAVDHALLLTGDIAGRDLDRIARDLGVECLRKPFRIEELLAAVDQILEAEVCHPRPN